MYIHKLLEVKLNEERVRFFGFVPKPTDVIKCILFIFLSINFFLVLQENGFKGATVLLSTYSLQFLKENEIEEIFKQCQFILDNCIFTNQRTLIFFQLLKAN